MQARPGADWPFVIVPAIPHPVVVGRFNAAFGIKGWIKVQSFTEPADQIFDYRPWVIVYQQKSYQIQCVEWRVHQAGFAVRLQDCSDRNLAEMLVRSEIMVPAVELPALKQGEYYWRDLEGLKVINHNGVALGVIDYLFETGSNDVMVVKGDKERFIPFLLDDVILRIDLNTREMHVIWELDF